MLPIASVSLPRRIQSTLLNFSGSSVASGATSNENASGGSPAAFPRSPTALTKSFAPPTISASPIAVWTNGATSDRSGDHAGTDGRIARYHAHRRSGWISPSAGSEAGSSESSAGCSAWK
jgi:hypothetical protein